MGGAGGTAVQGSSDLDPAVLVIGERAGAGVSPEGAPLVRTGRGDPSSASSARGGADGDRYLGCRLGGVTQFPAGRSPATSRCQGSEDCAVGRKRRSTPQGGGGGVGGPVSLTDNRSADSLPDSERSLEAGQKRGGVAVGGEQAPHHVDRGCRVQERDLRRRRDPAQEAPRKVMMTFTCARVASLNSCDSEKPVMTPAPAAGSRVPAGRSRSVMPAGSPSWPRYVLVHDGPDELLVVGASRTCSGTPPSRRGARHDVERAAALDPIQPVLACLRCPGHVGSRLRLKQGCDAPRPCVARWPRGPGCGRSRTPGGCARYATAASSSLCGWALDRRKSRYCCVTNVVEEGWGP